jgi:hypothetical protein
MCILVTRAREGKWPIGQEWISHCGYEIPRIYSVWSLMRINRSRGVGGRNEGDVFHRAPNLIVDIDWMGA